MCPPVCTAAIPCALQSIDSYKSNQNLNDFYCINWKAVVKIHMEIKVFRKADNILRRKSNVGILTVPELSIMWCFHKDEQKVM